MLTTRARCGACSPISNGIGSDKFLTLNPLLVDSSSHVERTVLAERSNFFEFHWPNQWLTNFSYAMKDALKDALLPIAGEKCRLSAFHRILGALWVFSCGVLHHSPDYKIFTKSIRLLSVRGEPASAFRPANRQST